MNRCSLREPVVFHSSNLKIFGVLHRPLEPTAGPCPGVVMYHGFMAAKYQPPHRLFVQLAEALASVGIVSLRIDLPGRGDSEGNTIDITLEDDFAAAQQALDLLATQPDVDDTRLALVGISWGGLLAATLAGRDPRVTATVLLSCAPSDRIDWKPTYQEVGGRRVHEFVGNLIGEQFYASLGQFTPLTDLTRTLGPVLFVYGSNDGEVSSAALALVEQRLATAGVVTDVVSIAGADHVFFAHYWQREVITTITTWLQRVVCKA